MTLHIIKIAINTFHPTSAAFFIHGDGRVAPPRDLRVIRACSQGSREKRRARDDPPVQIGHCQSMIPSPEVASIEGPVRDHVMQTKQSLCTKVGKGDRCARSQKRHVDL